jgi:hypothetical protein
MYTYIRLVLFAVFYKYLLKPVSNLSHLIRLVIVIFDAM